MVFTKNSPKTKAAGSKGGRSGKKHLSTMPKDKLKEFTTNAGKKSGEARRAKKLQRGLEASYLRAMQKEKQIMSTYLF